MKTMTDSEFRDDLKRVLDHATYKHDPVMITRQDGPDAIVISAAAYANLLENQFIVSNQENLKWILAGVQQLKAGKTHNIRR